jgi:branched-chain amino acid transport system permease protein
LLQTVINTVVLASIYTLFAMGMSLVWGTVGILNFAHGATFTFASFIGYLLVRHTSLPLVALLAIGIVVGAALSAFVEIAAFAPILRKAADLQSGELQIIAAGIGFASVLVGVAEWETKGNPFGFSGTTFETNTYQFGSAHITNLQIGLLITTVILAGGLIRWLMRSKSGLALRALGVDPATASLMGVNRNRLSVVAMLVAGALVGVAGVLLTLQLSAVTPSVGDSLLIKAFSAIILGGLGSMFGTVIGCVVLALCETLVLTYTSGQWVDAVSFGLILLVLLFRPQGILGRREVRRT